MKLRREISFEISSTGFMSVMSDMNRSPHPNLSSPIGRTRKKDLQSKPSLR
jgi:hypothetical protein